VSTPDENWLFRTLGAESVIWNSSKIQSDLFVLCWSGDGTSPPGHSQSVLPGRNVLVLESISDEKTHFILKVRCEQAARCPGCRRVSTACHSRYVRILQDLPWQGRGVYLWVTVRRFRCRNRRCSRKIFAERLPDIGRQYARRTARLLEVVRLVGYAAGGLPGSRLLNRLAIPISDDSVVARGRQPLRRGIG
jgi:hypothetical protein